MRLGESGQEAGQCLADCAPEQVSRFIRQQGFDAAAYFRATVRQAGELRSDRPTVRIIGNIWTDANRTRFASALRSAAAREGNLPTMVLWLRPSLSVWGMTTRLPEMLDGVRNQFAPDEGEERRPLRSVLIGDQDQPKRFSEAFNAIVRIPLHHLLQRLEVFLLPGRMAFVLVHAPIGVAEGYPIPLGIASFDPKVVERVHALMTDILAAAPPRPVYCNWGTDRLLEEIDAALDFSSSSSSKAQ
jgi:hypothetical protein